MLLAHGLGYREIGAEAGLQSLHRVCKCCPTALHEISRDPLAGISILWAAPKCKIKSQRLRMNEVYNVSDLVADFLAKAGMDTAFGISSVHNIPLLDAFSRHGGMHFVMARGEMGAAHMADGYARASGKPGLLITSTGPAAANACSGLLEALAACTPGAAYYPARPPPPMPDAAAVRPMIFRRRRPCCKPSARGFFYAGRCRRGLRHPCRGAHFGLHGAFWPRQHRNSHRYSARAGIARCKIAAFLAACAASQRSRRGGAGGFDRPRAAGPAADALGGGRRPLRACGGGWPAGPRLRPGDQLERPGRGLGGSQPKCSVPCTASACRKWKPSTRALI